MEKAIEFNIENEELKEYLEERIKEENIDYQIKIEDRWLEQYRDASNYYQVYCLYVNSNNLKKIEQFMQDLENGKIITDGIEELQDIDEENEKDKYKENKKKEKDNRFKIFTLKNFLKYYWFAIFLMGILIIIASKL